MHVICRPTQHYSFGNNMYIKEIHHLKTWSVHFYFLDISGKGLEQVLERPVVLYRTSVFLDGDTSDREPKSLRLSIPF